MAAALSAKKNGINDILIVERGNELGGILNQCIHSGFGLQIFKEELTGPEYAQRYIDEIKNHNIEFWLESTVLSLSPKKEIKILNRDKGLVIIKAKSVVLAMGCRERPRGAINIPGTRPAGIFSAGTAQQMINCQGIMPGKKVVILGSGDIGLIMARRMSLEGAKVEAVLEIQGYSSGLNRNIVQCLEDFDIPLYLSHTITEIKGKNRVESVIISKVDDRFKPIKGTEFEIECDIILFSVGLIPENELSLEAGIRLNSLTKGPIVSSQLETNVDGIFVCGNVLHVHDLVDFVSKEGELVGKNVANYIHGSFENKINMIRIEAGDGLSYVLPNYILNSNDSLSISFRVGKVFENIYISVYYGNRCIKKIFRRICLSSQMENIEIESLDFIDCKGGETIFVSIEKKEL